MADLKFKVDLDLKNAEKQLDDLMGKKLGIKSKGGSSSGKKSKDDAAKSKKSNGLLGNILSALGPLAVLLTLKPVTDILSLILNFFMLGIIQIQKLRIDLINAIITKLGEGWEYLKGLWETLKVKLTELKDLFVEWLALAIEWIKGLPAMIWEFLKGLPEQIWGYIQQGFNWLVEKFGILKEKLGELKEKLVEKLTQLKDKLVTKFLGLWETIKGLPGKIWEKIKEGFTWIKDKVAGVWESIKALPQLIWDKMKALAAMIGTAIKNTVGSLNPFKKSTSVNDAIIKPDGSVIKTHPNDTIIATQTPGSVGGGGKTFNFYGVTPQQMIDEVKRQLATEVNTASRY